MATHSSILAWEIPWAEEPGGLGAARLQNPKGVSTHAEFLQYISTLSNWGILLKSIP